MSQGIGTIPGFNHAIETLAAASTDTLDDSDYRVRRAILTSSRLGREGRWPAQKFSRKHSDEIRISYRQLDMFELFIEGESLDR
jgi:hypothetical protein